MYNQPFYGMPPVDPYAQLWQWFQAVDVDRSGQISVHELQRALSNGNLTFSEECARLLIKMFDRDGSGQIGWHEFKALWDYINQMRAAYSAVDQDRSGTLQANEVYNAITSSGYRISVPTFHALMAKCDRQRRGYLTLDGYIELCVLLGSIRNIFMRYDTDRDGFHNFSFEAFIQAMIMLYR